MSYYSKSKSELVKIGADAFTLLDDFSYEHKYKPKPSSSTTPPIQPLDKVFHYQYQREQAYVVRQQVMYATPIHATRIESTVVDCHEAAKRYGGTVIVDYSKRKPTRRGFFF
ncbi:hypothetical protein OSB04_010923 [Centaurea solstitialis]|uniref:Uncharacterized protein n=1 Tax=Centaurea solstitialis TaxID=347529 RepID=A0AA38WNL8_9ASTR|nr:hypothetical protein OSB04_010923 [Centaurea solstitialis]